MMRKRIVSGLVLVIMLVGCGLTNPDIDPTIDTTIDPTIDPTIDDIRINIYSINNLELGKDAQIKFKLWGYDARIADQAATLVNTYQYKIDKVPSSFLLEVQSDCEKQIEPNCGSDSMFSYYLTVALDSDNNGIIDLNDYIKDYDNSPETFYYGSQISELSIDLFLEKNTLLVSQDF
jgi:hypothetical protein